EDEAVRHTRVVLGVVPDSILNAVGICHRVGDIQDSVALIDLGVWARTAGSSGDANRCVRRPQRSGSSCTCRCTAPTALARSPSLTSGLRFAIKILMIFLRMRAD